MCWRPSCFPSARSILVEASGYRLPSNRGGPAGAQLPHPAGRVGQQGARDVRDRIQRPDARLQAGARANTDPGKGVRTNPYVPNNGKLILPLSLRPSVEYRPKPLELRLEHGPWRSPGFLLSASLISRGRLKIGETIKQVSISGEGGGRTPQSDGPQIGQSGPRAGGSHHKLAQGPLEGFFHRA